MKKINYLAVVIAIFSFSSCVSLNGFEEGKTLGKNNSEVGISVAYTSAPDILDEDGLGINSNVGYPTIDIQYKRGITDKFDAGARITSSLTAGFFMKYQVVGDQMSKFCVAPGLDVSTFAGVTYAIGIPIYMSIHPSKSLSINFAPKFSYQHATGSLTDGVNYLGGNVGLMFGKRHKFGIDLGYYSIGTDDDRASLINFALGGRFRFGDYNDDLDNDKPSKRKKSKR